MQQNTPSKGGPLVTQFQFNAPDLTEVNEALTRAFANIQGLRMYSESEVQAIKAAAFDEGFTTCAHEHMQQRENPSHPITRVNPYAR